MKTYEDKKQNLIKDIEIYTDNNIIVAFSGGVDSSVLLKLACESARLKGTKVHAVTITSELQPIKDLGIAKRVAEEIGAIHHVLSIDELEEAGIKNNPKNRCYLCKKYLFSSALELAKKLDIKTIIEGTNEDDLHVYRPGIKAIEELGILSPLKDNGITKEEVRKIALEYGLSVAKRPSAPCLATRFPYDTAINIEKIRNVEKGEEYIKSLGFKNVRMRVHDKVVRIEVDKEDIEKLITYDKRIIKYLKNLGYSYITVDLEGFRSGSMDL